MAFEDVFCFWKPRPKTSQRSLTPRYVAGRETMMWNLLVYATFFSFAPGHVFSHHVTASPQSGDLVPCEKGWFYFRKKCYRISGSKYSDSWKGASERCTAMGGHLATIESKEEQDFIVSFLLLDIKTSAWIGLSQYVWHDGSILNYTKWRSAEPSGLVFENEDCVEMYFEPQRDVIGEWNDVVCSKYNAYICQRKIRKQNISPDPTLCSPDVGGGWKFQQSCYHVIKEKKTWHEAEAYCKRNYNGGHLVTVLDTVVDKFLNYILSSLDEELWIGINIKDWFQQQWSSGWYMGYSGLSDDLKGFHEEYCVTRNKFKQWNAVECSKEFFFICETSKTKPPVLPKPPLGFHCPEGIEGLRDLGGEKCYYIDTKSQLNWYRANFECGRRCGSLASIHSNEELHILEPFIRYSQSGLFIGLFRSLAEGEDFVWSDGSNMNFENWNDNEPNNVEEKCGEIDTRSLGWNDAHCNGEKGYICSIPKIGIFSSELKSHNNATHVTLEEMEDCSGIYETMLKCIYKHKHK